MITRHLMRLLLTASFAATAFVATTGPALAQAQDNDMVVYHIDDAEHQALKGLRNVKNHLDTDPKAKIFVVTHAKGVQMLMEGAKDKNGSAYAGPIAALKARGVKFEVCEITLKNGNIKKSQFILEADFTPSGVLRIAQLQHMGAAYIKP